jgi:hypothetical protein
MTLLLKSPGGFSDSESIPGKGAEVGGDFQLTVGMLSIVVGGQGQQADFSGGGGGGSFVHPVNEVDPENRTGS